MNPDTLSMHAGAGLVLRPLRLRPGQDLREALLAALADAGWSAGFVLAGIGSLSAATLRLAGAAETLALRGDLELLNLSGSLAPGAVHLHASLAGADGRVLGGHLGAGCLVRTTAELLLGGLPDWRFDRVDDPDTGYRELRIRPR